MQRFDQLDRAALGSILVLSALTALVILRGDQVGARVRQTTPPHLPQTSPRAARSRWSSPSR
jgi:hypothetical protein